MLTRKIHSVLIMLLLLFFVACSDDDSPTGSDQSYSTVKGRVTLSGGNSGINKTTTGVEGATVNIARVKSDGSIEIISNAAATTNSNGEFEVQTTTEASANIIIVAEKDGTRWKALLSGELQHNTTLYAPPVNEESTAESEVYEEAVAQNDTESANSGEIRLFINAEFAAEIMADQSNAAKFRTALKAEAGAYSKALADSYYGGISAAEQKRSALILEAQTELNNQLYFAGESQAEINAAWENFYAGFFSMMANANIDVEHHARAKAVSTYAMVHSTTDLDANAQFYLERRAKYVKARAAGEALLSVMSEADMEQMYIDMAAQASAELYTDVETAANHDQINAAFVSFKSGIKAILETKFSAYAQAIASVDSMISSSLAVTLHSSLEATSSAEIMLNAYTSFYTAISAAVESSVEGASDTELSVMASLMILANINA